MEKLLITRVKSSNEPDALVALEIGLHLDLFSRRPTRERSWRFEEIDSWRSVSTRIFEECVYHIEVLCEESLRLCFDAFWQGQVSIRNFTNWHGVEILFRDCGYTLLPNTSTYNIATSLLISVLSLPPRRKFLKRWENNLHHIEEIGYVLLSYPLPWLTKSQPQRYASEDFLRRFDFHINQPMEESLGKICTINSSALFGAFTLFAALLEASDEQLLIKEIEQIKDKKNSLFNSIYWTFIAHFNPAERDKVQAELDHCGFTPEQQAFAWHWVRREINLVEWTAGGEEEG